MAMSLWHILRKTYSIYLLVTIFETIRGPVLSLPAVHYYISPLTLKNILFESPCHCDVLSLYSHKTENMFWAGHCWIDAQRKLTLDHPEMLLSRSDLKQIF